MILFKALFCQIVSPDNSRDTMLLSHFCLVCPRIVAMQSTGIALNVYMHISEDDDPRMIFGSFCIQDDHRGRGIHPLEIWA